MERGGHHHLLRPAAGAHLRTQPANRLARFLVRAVCGLALREEEKEAAMVAYLRGISVLLLDQ